MNPIIQHNEFLYRYGFMIWILLLPGDVSCGMLYMTGLFLPCQLPPHTHSSCPSMLCISLEHCGTFVLGGGGHWIDKWICLRMNSLSCQNWSVKWCLYTWHNCVIVILSMFSIWCVKSKHGAQSRAVLCLVSKHCTYPQSDQNELSSVLYAE